MHRFKTPHFVIILLFIQFYRVFTLPLSNQTEYDGNEGSFSSESTSITGNESASTSETSSTTLGDEGSPTFETTTTTQLLAGAELTEPRFTYGDFDTFGPLHWRNSKVAEQLELQSEHGNTKPSTTFSWNIKNLYGGTYCQNNWLSPVNIQTDTVQVQEEMKEIEYQALREEIKGTPETLVLSITKPSIENSVWLFGHPEKYHGIEITPRSSGQIYLTDNFDPLGRTNILTKYEFEFLTLFYCDLRKSPPHRTMHQVNGRRFPLELEFVFLRKINPAEVPKFFPVPEQEDTETEVDEMVGLYEGNRVAVILTVLGDSSLVDHNSYFDPIIQAAKAFRGKDFKEDASSLELDKVIIKGPWSPTWLLPDISDYYYYDAASFPVPPCWKVARNYILREHITISREQLEALTHIQTKREKGTREELPCTHSVSLVPNSTRIESGTPVKMNMLAYELRGKDGKPRTKEQIRTLLQGKRKRDQLRNEMLGNSVKWRKGSVFVDEEPHIHDTSGIRKKIPNNILLVFVLLYLR